jgi:phage gpG-like protein
MPQSKITLQDEELRGAIDRLYNATGNLKPANQDVGESGLNFIQSYFDQEREPSGAPWQAVAPETLKRKRKKRFRLKTLQQRGILVRSMRYAATASSLVVGTNIDYAAIHQFGGTISRQGGARRQNFRIGRNGRSRFARASRANFQQEVQVGAYTINMPQRKFLNLDEDPAFIAEASAIYADHFLKAWNG